MPKKIPVGVIGATGYTGVELIRLLLKHPHVEITSITSRQYEGKKLEEVFPSFTANTPLVCEPLEVKKIANKVQVVFLCLPHHEAMSVAKQFRLRGVRVIDLSADFRIKDAAVYEEWYGPHSQKNLLKEAVYGLPELYREDIQNAKLVASPGCYPTSILLGLAPLIQNKMIDLGSIICDSKSGVSGAGRAAKVETLFTEVNDSFKPYNTGKHRHTPEIEQELSIMAGEAIKILFSPHLVPMDRGILSSIYCKPLRKWDAASIRDVYNKFYRQSKFVHVLPVGQFPSTKNVRGTNHCHISIVSDDRTEKVAIFSAIDNLTKGASGQAVQSFNLMFNLPEDSGLTALAVIP